MNIKRFETIGYFIKNYFNWSMDYSELEGLIDDFMVRENDIYIEAFRREIEEMYTLNDPELFKQVAYRLGDRGMPTNKAKNTMTLLYEKTRKKKKQ